MSKGNNAARFQRAPEPGEFWLAEFHFDEDRLRSKVRPVFVLKSYPYGVLVAYISTQKMEDTSSRTDVLLGDEDAMNVGLLRGVRICFGRRETLSLTHFKRRVGELGMPGINLGSNKFREIADAVRAAGIL